MNEFGYEPIKETEEDKLREKIRILREALGLYDCAIDEAEEMLGGEFSMHFGPFFDMVHKARAALEATK